MTKILLTGYLMMTWSGITCIPAVSCNVFIIAINIQHWVKSQGLSPGDLIICSFGVSNIILICMSVLTSFLFYLWKNLLFQDHIQMASFILMLTFESSNLWFATWLCLYFCVKIVNCKWSFFLQLKMKVPKMVPWILLGTILESLVITMPMDWKSFMEYSTNLTANTSKNVSSVSRFNSAFWIYFAFCILGFITFFLSAMAILASLYEHVRRMKKNLDSFRNPRLEAHFAAAKTVTSLLTLYIIYFVMLMIWISKGSNETTMLDAIFCIVSTIDYTLRPMVLILGSTRMKKSLSGILHLLKCCCRRGV